MLRRYARPSSIQRICQWDVQQESNTRTSSWQRTGGKRSIYEESFVLSAAEFGGHDVHLIETNGVLPIIRLVGNRYRAQAYSTTDQRCRAHDRHTVIDSADSADYYKRDVYDPFVF